MDDTIGDNGWMQTFTGLKFNPLKATVDQIDIRDIAQALSLQCRYNGHTRSFYSTAEHSFHLSHHVPENDRLWALLHDAAEAYVGDMLRPLKRVFPEFGVMEDRLMSVIAERFDLTCPRPESIGVADKRILADERNRLMGPPPAPWFIGERVEPLGVEIMAWSPSVARSNFMARFRYLTATDLMAEYA